MTPYRIPVIEGRSRKQHDRLQAIESEKFWAERDRKRQMSRKNRIILAVAIALLVVGVVGFLTTGTDRSEGFVVDDPQHEEDFHGE